MWKMNRDLSLCIPTGDIFPVQRLVGVFVVGSDYFPYSKLSRNSETDASNHRSWTEVSQLVGVVADAFCSAIIAVDEGCIR